MSGGKKKKPSSNEGAKKQQVNGKKAEKGQDDDDALLDAAMKAAEQGNSPSAATTSVAVGEDKNRAQDVPVSVQEQYKAKGNEAFKVKKNTEALEWYTKAIDLGPEVEAAGAIYSNRAAVYTALGMVDQAIADGESCIRLRPKWVKGYYRKGVALESAGKLEEAMKAFNEALKVDPKNQEVEVKAKALRHKLDSKVLPCAPALSVAEMQRISPALTDLYKREYHWFTKVFPAENWNKNKAHAKRHMQGINQGEISPYGYKMCTIHLALVLAGATPCCCITDMICEEFGPAWGKELFEPWLKRYQDVLAPLKIRYFFNKSEEEPNRGLVIYRESDLTREADFEPALKIPFDTSGSFEKASQEKLRKVYGYPSHYGYLQVKICLFMHKNPGLLGQFLDFETTRTEEHQRLLEREVVVYSFFVNEDSSEDMKAGAQHCNHIMSCLKNFGLETDVNLMCYAFPEENMMMPIKFVAFFDVALQNGDEEKTYQAINNNPMHRECLERFSADTKSMYPQLVRSFAQEWPKTTLYDSLPERLRQGSQQTFMTKNGNTIIQAQEIQCGEEDDPTPSTRTRKERRKQ